MTYVVASLVERSVSGVSSSSKKAFRQGADLVEVRLDHLRPQACDAKALASVRAAVRGPMIATLRSSEEGGRSRLRGRSREKALRAVLAAGFEYVDLELARDSRLLGEARRRSKGPNRQIYVLPTSGAPAWQFTQSGDLDNQWPSWSADGSFMIYGQSQIGGGIPWLVMKKYEDRDNANETRIPPFGLTIAEPSLSPDMQWVVYESWPDGNNHDIYLMHISGDTSTRLRLTKDTGFDFSPAWRPPVQP